MVIIKYYLINKLFRACAILCEANLYSDFTVTAEFPNRLRCRRDLRVALVNVLR